MKKQSLLHCPDHKARAFWAAKSPAHAFSILVIETFEWVSAGKIIGVRSWKNHELREQLQPGVEKVRAGRIVNQGIKLAREYLLSYEKGTIVQYRESGDPSHVRTYKIAADIADVFMHSSAQCRRTIGHLTKTIETNEMAIKCHSDQMNPQMIHGMLTATRSLLEAQGHIEATLRWESMFFPIIAARAEQAAKMPTADDLHLLPDGSSPDEPWNARVSRIQGETEARVSRLADHVVAPKSKKK